MNLWGNEIITLASFTLVLFSLDFTDCAERGETPNSRRGGGCAITKHLPGLIHPYCTYTFLCLSISPSARGHCGIS